MYSWFFVHFLPRLLLFTAEFWGVLYNIISSFFLLFSLFLLLLKYSCLNFLPFTPPYPSHLHLPHSILPPFGFSHVSFVHVPWQSFSPLILTVKFKSLSVALILALCHIYDVWMFYSSFQHVFFLFSYGILQIKMFNINEAEFTFLIYASCFCCQVQGLCLV